MRFGLLLASLMAAGCATTHETDVLPGISSSLTIGDLDDQQRTTLCEYTLTMWGSTDGTPVTLECSDGRPYTATDMATCVEDYARHAGACARAVEREVEYIDYVAERCDEADFRAALPNRGPC